MCPSTTFSIAVQEITQKFSTYENNKYLLHHSFIESGIQERFSWVVLAQSLSWLKLRFWHKLWLFEDLTDTGESAFKETPSLLFVASVPYHVNVSMELLEGSHDMVTGFPQGKKRKKERTRHKLQYLLWPSLEKSHTITSSIFCGSHRPTLIYCGRGLHKGLNTRSQVSFRGPAWRLAATHIDSFCYYFYKI